MCKLILVFTLFISINSQAFNDKMTFDQIMILKNRAAATNDLHTRKNLLERFKNLIFDRLNTIELPDLESTPDDDPRIENYRSLTEFDGYINLITLKQLGPETCEKNAVRIQASSRGNEGELPAEAKLALNILAELCQ